MKNRKYVAKIRNRIIILTALLVIVCVSFSASYSNYVFETSDYRAVEMFVNKLSYEININDVYTSNISIKPGNVLLNVDVTSLNETKTKYKLTYSDNDNINIFDLDNNSKGTIESNEKKNIRLLVSNMSDNIINLEFSTEGGYYTNDLSDINASNGYKEINKTLVIGQEVKYNTGNNQEYLVTSEMSGYFENQKVIKKDTKWKLLNINDDGSIDIISSDSLTINKKNDLLRLNGSKGYNNGVYILNDIVNNLYGNNTSIGRNLNIEDIEELMSDVWNKEEFINPQTDNGYIEYTKNTYVPIQFLNNISKSESGELIVEDDTKELDTLNIITDYWSHEMNKENFKSDIYYDLFMNKKYTTWLSSRFVNAFDSYALFGISTLTSSEVSGNLLYSSINDTFSASNAIRPVINIKSPIYVESNIIKIKESN